MEIILLEKIANLGDLGDIVQVKNGYARNYLLPHGKALMATEEHRELVEHRREELEQRMQDSLDAAQERAQVLDGLEVIIPARASTEGILYGSIGAREIAEAINAAGVGVEVERQEIVLNEGPLRNLESYQVGVRMHPEVFRSISVAVVAE